MTENNNGEQLQKRTSTLKSGNRNLISHSLSLLNVFELLLLHPLDFGGVLDRNDDFSSSKFFSNSFASFFFNLSATFVSQVFLPPLSWIIAEHLCVCVVFQNRPDFGLPRSSPSLLLSSILYSTYAFKQIE